MLAELSQSSLQFLPEESTNNCMQCFRCKHCLYSYTLLNAELVHMADFFSSGGFCMKAVTTVVDSYFFSQVKWVICAS